MKEKAKQKGFIQRKVLWIVIIGIVLFVTAGYVGIKYYQNYSNNKLVKQESDNKLAAEKEKQDAEIQALKKEMEDIKNQQAQDKTTQEKTTSLYEQYKTTTESNSTDLTLVIAQWRPAIAYVVCSWRYTDGSYLRKSGSGLFLSDSVVTNLHVVEEQGMGAESCVVSLPGDSDSVVVYNQNLKTFEKDLDAAVITINNPTSYMKTLVNVKRQVCNATPPVGAKVAVLGYPSIGSPTDITATDGIVSGYDGDYYITSAKIEHGNSGGVALWVEKDCNLGIPTNVSVGTVESLGRILDFRVLFLRMMQ